jgi:hypothetical protein
MRKRHEDSPQPRALAPAAMLLPGMFAPPAPSPEPAPAPVEGLAEVAP